MNEDTDAVFTALQNDEILYGEVESAAWYAATVAADEDAFHDELMDELSRIITDNRHVIPGFSHTEPIEYENVSASDIADCFKYDDYR